MPTAFKLPGKMMMRGGVQKRREKSPCFLWRVELCIPRCLHVKYVSWCVEQKSSLFYTASPTHLSDAPR